MEETRQSPREKISFDEQFGWKQIDQLHAATLQFSGNCLEYKKLCVGLITAVPTLLIKFTNNRLDTSLFVAALLIGIFFWIIDAQSYYYQELLRERMKEIANEVRIARSETMLVNGVGMPIVDRPKSTRRFRSYFNMSQLPYMIFLTIELALWIAFCFGWIGR
jgi:hypothetical protein